jgi:transcriptional regulator with XRE-family HTH domain
MPNNENIGRSERKKDLVEHREDTRIIGFADKDEFHKAKNLFEQEMGQNIRSFRRGLGLTQAEMAKMLGVSQQELSKMESSGGNLSTTQLFRLRIMGADLASLFDTEDVGRVLDDIRKLWEGGIKAVYPTRSEALQGILPYLRRERLGIYIFGSSLKGITMDRPFINAIDERLRVGAKLKILLTHPAFSVLRARVEGRDSQALRLEMNETIKIHCQRWQSLAYKHDQFEVRIALNPPTVFFILLISERRAIINPYPLTIEAYHCPCLMVANNDKPDCIYNQYLKHHFLNAWDCEKRLHREVSIDLKSAMKDKQLEKAIELIEAIDNVFTKSSNSEKV